MPGCPYTNYGPPRSFMDLHAQQLDAHNANVDIQSCVMVAHLYAMGGQLSRMGFHVCEWKSTRLCGRPKSGHTYIWISTSSVGCPRSSRRSGGNPRVATRHRVESHALLWPSTRKFERTSRLWGNLDAHSALRGRPCGLVCVWPRKRCTLRYGHA